MKAKAKVPAARHHWLHPSLQSASLHVAVVAAVYAVTRLIGKASTEEASDAGDGHPLRRLLSVAFAAVFVLAALNMLWRRWKYDLHKIPSPPGLPFLGQSLALMQMSNSEISYERGKWFRALGYPKIMRVSAFGTTILCVVDAECAKSILSQPVLFPRREKSFGHFTLMIGNDQTGKALFNDSQTKPYAKAVRKIYTTGFQSSNLKLAMPRLDAVFDKMIAVIEETRQKGPIDFQKLCVKTTLDAIGAVAFETNLGGLDGSRELYQLLIDTGHVALKKYLHSTKTTYASLFPMSEAGRQQAAIIDRLTAEWDRLVDIAMQREDPTDGSTPLWHALKHLIDPETNKPLTRKNLISEFASAVVAGMDSTGHQLSWILGLLASHPHVLDKLLEELKQHDLYGPTARAVVYEDLGDLTYLSAIVKEGMRIAGVVTSTFHRVPAKDTTIMGYRIPKGTVIQMLSNRWIDSEAEWGDPLVFRPERWLTDEDMSQKYYLGFSYGPRDCAGQKLAKVEMRLAVIKLVTKYKLMLKSPFLDLMKESRNGLVIESKNGIPIEVTPRDLQQ